MPLANRRPETPTATITRHQEYRVALERIGQLEDLRTISMSESLELDVLRAAVEDYQCRSGADRSKIPPPSALSRNHL